MAESSLQLELSDAVTMPSPLSALMFTSPDGGIGQYTWCLASALRKGQNVRSQVLMSAGESYDTAPLVHASGHDAYPILRATHGGRLQKMANAAINSLLFAQATRRRDKTTGLAPQIVHVQWTLTPRADRAFWEMLQRWRLPLVYTAHDVMPHERRPDDIAHNLWRYRRADALIVHGERLREQLLEMAQDIDPAKVHIVPHGSFVPIADDPLLAAWDRERARKSFGYTEDERVVLFFGYIRPYKGLDTLVEALRQIHQTPGAPRIRLLIAGRSMSEFGMGGDESERIRDAGLETLTTRVTEYIPLADLGRYFRAADVVALPYKSGSQSGILQMAYAFERPAVLTNVGSIAEVTVPGQTALVVPPNDPEAFAAALSGLLTDPVKARQMGQAGHQYAETELSWGEIAKTTRQLYNHLLMRA